jgi:hypothetical protein
MQVYVAIVQYYTEVSTARRTTNVVGCYLDKYAAWKCALRAEYESMLVVIDDTLKEYQGNRAELLEAVKAYKEMYDKLDIDAVDGAFIQKWRSKKDVSFYDARFEAEVIEKPLYWK